MRSHLSQRIYESFGDGEQHSIVEVARSLKDVIPAPVAARHRAGNQDRNLKADEILTYVDEGRCMIVREWVRKQYGNVTITERGPRKRIDQFRLNPLARSSSLSARRHRLALLKGRYPGGVIDRASAKKEARDLHLSVHYVRLIVRGAARPDIVPLCAR